MVAPNASVRAAPSGPIVAPGSVFWQEIPLDAAIPNGNGSVLITPRVQLEHNGGPGVTASFTLSIPKPSVPDGYKAEIVDARIIWGGDAATSPGADPTIGFFSFVGEDNDPTSNVQQIGSYTQSPSGPFNVNIEAVATENMVAGVPFPALIPNGKSATMRLDIDSEGYNASLYINTFEVKWRVSPE